MSRVTQKSIVFPHVPRGNQESRQMPRTPLSIMSVTEAKRYTTHKISVYCRPVVWIVLCPVMF